MAKLGYGALAVAGSALLYANLPTRWTLGAAVPSVDYLSKAKLIPIIDDESRIDEKISVLVAVVHETKGVNEFKPYFKGDIYYDKERHFYGPNERWLPLWMGFLRIKTYVNMYKTKKAGFVGNTDGEGRLLGGLYLVSNNELIYTHLEKEWGDAANIDEVRDAIKKFK
ncbi:hypothetical protein TELCIR_08587 [Teladorsagia circumcincta]|uniref:Peroxiredoxin-like 2A n=1 Tax=Teladorsagia circumcincta TaxID=45464 RepID=A0A2G9UH81_TELCI|nr:hypothetical protein TELCIR_08587 [Teladorsagia circumcincta]